METTTNIIIAEDKKTFREIIVRELKKRNVNTLAEAENGLHLIQLLEEHLPDLVLLDIEMPVMNGKEALQMIRKQYPDLKIILLSFHTEQVLIDYFISLGANGFVSKTAVAADLELLLHAIEIVKAGGIFVQPE